MSRYIDLQEFEERIKKYIKPETLEEKALLEWCKDECIRQAYCMPTTDVVEVRHGEWIYHECVSSYDGCKSGYSCSVCNAFVDEQIFDTDEFHKVFCGNCGAKMDGEIEREIDASGERDETPIGRVLDGVLCEFDQNGRLRARDAFCSSGERREEK